MEVIERVQLKVTLQAGKLWRKGAILTAPFPPEILREIQLKTGTVEVLKVPVEKLEAKLEAKVEAEVEPEVEPEVESKGRVKVKVKKQKREKLYRETHD